MAKTYPKKLLERDCPSFAERTMFEHLKTQLDSTYTVYHAFHWTANANTPREIDFVVFHPEKGFIVLEVKGGEIQITDGDWFSKNETGIHPIKDPFRQVQNNMYFLRDFYHRKAGEPFPGIFAYGVCFPDTEHMPDDIHPEMTDTNVLFNRHLDKIEHWIEGLFSPSRKHIENRMGSKTAQIFHDILHASMLIPLSIRSALQQQREELAKINLFQDYLLDIFEDRSRVAMQGSAGTGKTWIAIKKAARLISQGKSCLFLCYNKLLGSRLKDLARQEREKLTGATGTLDIHTFHAFSNRILIEYIESILDKNKKQSEIFFETTKNLFPDKKIESAKGFVELLFRVHDDGMDAEIDVSVLEDNRELDARLSRLLCLLLTESKKKYFDLNVPVALRYILENNLFEIKKYDAILIDEGQDFKKKWSECLPYLFKNEKKRIAYVFYDNNQNIFTKKNEDLPIIDLISKEDVAPYLFRLRRNIRNTKSIYDYASTQTNLGKTARTIDLEGIQPYEFTCEGEKKARKQVGKIITELVEKDRISNERIVVLTNISIRHSIFKEKRKVGNFKLTVEEKGTQKNHVRLQSVRRFKGLESDIVILLVHPSDRDLDNQTELLYVGYTRAKFLLYVIEITMP